MNGLYYKLRRKKIRMTQAAVANKLGISRHSLSKYEEKDTDMPITVALNLNKLFDINPDSMKQYLI